MREDELDLAGGEAVDGLVGGDAVFVEAADLRPGVEDDDVVAVHGQAMGAGEAGRAAADHGDALAGEGARGRRAARRRQSRRRWRSAATGRCAPACPRRPRARRPPRTASRSGRRGRTCRRRCSAGRWCAAAPTGLSVRISRMKSGMSMPGRAGVDAGRVVAEVAAVGLDERLVALERRMQIAEVGAVVFRLQTTGGNIGNPVARHRYPLVLRSRLAKEGPVRSLIIWTNFQRSVKRDREAPARRQAKR